MVRFRYRVSRLFFSETTITIESFIVVYYSCFTLGEKIGKLFFLLIDDVVWSAYKIFHNDIDLLTFKCFHYENNMASVLWT